jgi:hypothetical protein
MPTHELLNYRSNTQKRDPETNESRDSYKYSSFSPHFISWSSKLFCFFDGNQSVSKKALHALLYCDTNTIIDVRGDSLAD